MPENKTPRKALQYRPQEKRDLQDLTVVGRTSSCSCKRELNPKLRMEEEEDH